MTEDRFAFGKNWQSYLENSFTPQALENAERAMREFFQDFSLEGKSFLDVGCGSGIHSLVAKRLGASRIVSIDVDKDSVACTTSLAQKDTSGTWSVCEGSMLDKNFMDSLGQFDVVYCWGVAHHSGKMWPALEQLAHNVDGGGYLYIAIYNTLEGLGGSRTWTRIKKFYVQSPRIIQKILEYGYFLSHVAKITLHFKNPVRVMRAYSKKRGMSYWHDLVDWLGGYPYEHARVEEIFLFYTKKHTMELVNLKTQNFLGNNQFLFKKR